MGEQSRAIGGAARFFFSFFLLFWFSCFSFFYSSYPVMESIKCSHILIEEVEIRARWNAEQQRLNSSDGQEKIGAKNATGTDYSWLVDNAFNRQVTLLNACQALRLRTLSSNLRLEDTGSIIKIFRSCNQPEFRLEQLVDLMADVLMSYVDEKQRIQLLR